MRRILKMTAAVWFGLLALSVGIQLIPWSYAQTSTTEAPPIEDAATFPAGVGYLGGGLGIGTADNDVGTGLGYAGELAFFPKQYVGLGAFYRGVNHGAPKSNIWGGEILLRPIQPLSLGFLIGGADLNDAGANTATAFAYGGKLGYDFRLGSTPFTLGPELNVLFYKPNQQTITNVNTLAAFKIWI